MLKMIAANLVESGYEFERPSGRYYPVWAAHTGAVRPAQVGFDLHRGFDPRPKRQVRVGPQAGAEQSTRRHRIESASAADVIGRQDRPARGEPDVVEGHVGSTEGKQATGDQRRPA